MIWGKVEKVIFMEIYDEDGKFLTKRAQYIYKPILMWYDVIFILITTYVIFARTV